MYLCSWEAVRIASRDVLPGLLDTPLEARTRQRGHRAEVVRFTLLALGDHDTHALLASPYNRIGGEVRGR